MSFVITAPQTMAAAATDLADISSTISSANAAAAAPTTGLVAAGADEVSAAISGLFNAYAREFQALSAQAATFHEQLVSLLNGGAAAYLGAEIANAEQALISVVNVPAQTLLGHPLIPTGGPSAFGQGAGAIMAAGRSAVDAAAGATAALAAEATPGIAGPYQDLITTTSANLQSLGSTWATNPAPFLRQIVANQMAYGQTIATSLQNAAQHLGTALSDPSALNHVVTDLFPIAAIPAQIQQNVVNIGTTLTKVAPAAALAALGPPLSTLGDSGPPWRPLPARCRPEMSRER
ncbi:PE family protein [Mycobacterium kansasii 732]|nr:PE family protein [Mycobacterium kansasii 732]